MAPIEPSIDTYKLNEKFTINQAISNSNGSVMEKSKTNHLNRQYLSLLPFIELEQKKDMLQKGMQEAKQCGDTSALIYLYRWMDEVEGAIELKNKLVHQKPN